MIGLIYLSGNKWWFDTIVLEEIDRYFDSQLTENRETQLKSYRVSGDPATIKKGWAECKLCTKECCKDVFMLYKNVKVIKYL